MPLFARRFVVASALALACGGCSEEGQQGSSPATLQPATLDPNVTPRLELTEDLRLDANAEDFSVVSQLAVGARGHIVVPLRQDREVRVYDEAGARIATVGRLGSGPGEFQQIGVVGWTGDTIWVVDLDSYRVTTFAADGSGVRTRPIPTPELARDSAPPSQLFRVLPSAIYADQSILASSWTWVDGEWSRLSEPIMVKVPAEGPARLFASLPGGQDPRWFMEVAGLGRSVPFAMSPRTAVAPDGSRFARLAGDVTSSEGGTVTLTMVAASGDTLFDRIYPFVGVPVTSAQRDSALAEILPEPGAPPPGEGPPDLERRFHDVAAERIPPAHAPVTGLTLGLDGTIWIGLAETEAGRITLVLNDRGDPIGHVQLPGRSVLRQASADHIWVTESDAVDLNSVVRYRVTGLVP